VGLPKAIPIKCKHTPPSWLVSAPDVIVANSTPVLAALKQATRTIPIVFSIVSDPAGQSFVDSLGHPGGNITGFSFVEFPMLGKWLEMLKEIAPSIKRTALVFNPQTAPYYAAFLRNFKAAPTTLAAELSAMPVRDEAEIEAAVSAFAREPGGGLIVTPDTFMSAHRAIVIALAERHRLPAFYGVRHFVKDRGLISYGRTRSISFAARPHLSIASSGANGLASCPCNRQPSTSC
jgi:putative tryptophan/tyrosine transport system substrate-binding protein